MPGITRSYSELVSRTRWYVMLRWFVLLLVIVPSLSASFYDVGMGPRFLRDVLFCAIALLSNSVFHVLTHVLRTRMAMKILAYVLVLADVALVTFFIYSKGGIESRSVVLYILPMVAAAAILGRKGIYLTTAFAIIGFTFIIVGGYTGLFGQPLSMYTPMLDHDPGYVINTIVFFDFVLFVAATAVDYLTRLLLQGEWQAQEALENMRRAQLIAKTGNWEYDVLHEEMRYSEELFSVLSEVVPGRILRNREFLELVYLEDRPFVRRKLMRALRRPMTFSFEHRMIARDGTVRYLHVDGQSFTNNDANGPVTRIIGSARDITEEKAIQKAHNDFVALASHQLRTPATIVKQYVGMLKDGMVGTDPREQQRLLQIAYDTNDRQIKIINDLLNVARLDSNSYKIERKHTDLAHLLADIVRDQTSKFATKQQRLGLRGAGRPLTARVDADSLRMALDNLLDNAHKYTPDGKSVVVSLRRSARSAIITISDRGVGIAKNDLPKLFKLFSRAENPVTLQQEGSGLGLYWAERIISLHKGKIAVTSEVGKGTTFTVTVPL